MVCALFIVACTRVAGYDSRWRATSTSGRRARVRHNFCRGFEFVAVSNLERDVVHEMFGARRAFARIRSLVSATSCGMVFEKAVIRALLRISALRGKGRCTAQCGRGRARRIIHMERAL